MTSRILHAARAAARRVSGSFWNGGLLSLITPTVIVLAVLAFAVASYSLGPSDPSVAPVYGSASAPPRSSGLYVDGFDVKRPVTLIAAIYVEGWRDRSQRIIETQITSASPVAVRASEGDATPARLVGSRVLASVSDQAAKEVPSHGSATVELVVVPKGQGAAVVIDRVLGGPTAAALPPKPSGAVVQALSTYAALPGTSVTITGRGFGAQMRDSWVTCCGARALATSWSDTSVTFTVPVSAKRAGYVGVVVNSSTSNGLYFVPAAPPVLQDITPRQGAAGTIVTLSGHGFGATRNGGWVTFAGSSAEVVSWTDASIRVVVPKGASAGYAGVVANGLTSNGVLYAPYGAPLVETVSVRRMTVGDVVTLAGRNFGTVAGDVVLAGARLKADSWGPSEVRLTLPADMKTGYLGIIKPGGWTSNGVFVTVAPRVTAVSRWWGSPQSSLTISGLGFGSAQGVSRVVVNGTTAPVDSWSSSSITFRIPDAASSGYVGVATSEGSSNGIYVVVETQASLTAVTPTAAKPGDTITLTGADFGVQTRSSRVLIGGSHECAISDWSAVTITAVVPDGCPSGYVGVVKQGVASNGRWLTVGP